MRLIWIPWLHRQDKDHFRPHFIFINIGYGGEWQKAKVALLKPSIEGANILNLNLKINTESELVGMNGKMEIA